MHTQEVTYAIFLLGLLKGSTTRWQSSVAFKVTIASIFLTPALLYGINLGLRDDLPLRVATHTLAFASLTIVQNAVFSFYILPRFPDFLETLEMQGDVHPGILRKVRVSIVPSYLGGTDWIVIFLHSSWLDTKH